MTALEERTILAAHRHIPQQDCIFVRDGRAMTLFKYRPWKGKIWVDLMLKRASTSLFRIAVVTPDTPSVVVHGTLDKVLCELERHENLAGPLRVLFTSENVDQNLLSELGFGHYLLLKEND